MDLCQTRDGEFNGWSSHAFCFIAPCHLVLDYTIAYVLCTYNPLFLTDQFSLKKLPLQFSLSHEASLFVFQLNEQIVATAGAFVSL